MVPPVPACRCRRRRNPQAPVRPLRLRLVTVNWTVDVPVEQLPELPPPTSDAHDALADARLNRLRWEAIEAAVAAR